MRGSRVAEVATVFVWLGATAFGGPAAHIGLMHRELVERRRWVEESTFLDLVGITALLPGPNSTELAIELGRRRAGTTGLVAAGVAFITPAAVMVGLLAWAYTRYTDTAGIADVRYGILPVVVAVIAHATWQLGRRAVTGPLTGVVALGAAGAFLAGVHELLILVIGAAATGLWVNRHRLARGTAALVPWGLAGAPSPVTTSDLGLLGLFGSFLRIGALLFGSGYVIVAFLRAEFVERLGLITAQQLLDAVAIGQVTPGPLFTTATFVGYLVHGPAGAVVATVAIFLPAFVLIAALGRFIGPLLRSRVARPVLDGVNAASVGLIAGVAGQLAGDAVVDVLTGAAAVGALAVLLSTKVSATWLLLAGVGVGLLHAVV